MATNPAHLLAGYRLIRRLGTGGMSDVFLAEHVASGGLVALKLLDRALSAEHEHVARFYNEARAAASISHASIVPVYEVGRAADGTAFIAMQVLDGEALSDRLVRRGPLPVREALPLIRQLASALGAAHAAGIVHRDIKPSNIMLVADPDAETGERAKVLDFGLAKLADAANVHTRTSVLMGTPAYMAPEQCRGAGQVDARADVYALACVLYALASGAPPFRADGLGELLMMHIREPAPPLSTRAAGIAPTVDAFVARCLAKEPAARPADGFAMLRDLVELETELARIAKRGSTVFGTVAPAIPTYRASAAAEPASTTPASWTPASGRKS